MTYWENATGKIWLRAPNAGNITVLLPSSGGTLALTTDIPSVPVDSVNGQTGVVVLDTGDIDENGNLYYTEARVAANSAVAANTAKVGITTQQADDITANNAKTGITAQQASDITTNNDKVGVIAGGTTGQALVKASGTDYDTEWADIAIDTQYHDRFQTDAETFRSGATATVELYYTAKADGDGLAESASSDTPATDKIIRRKIYYSEAAFADPDTGTWVEFTPAPADDASFATVKAALLEYLKARTGGTVPISLKQTWEEVDESILLLDTYTGAAAAYSLRKLRAAYTGDAIEVYNGSSYADIGFSNNELDTTALAAHCGSNDGFISKWYDQSSNTNDAVQTNTALMPKIYDGQNGVIEDNGKPAMDFTADKLHATFTYSVTAMALIGVGEFSNIGTRFLSQLPQGVTRDWQGDRYRLIRSGSNLVSSRNSNLSPVSATVGAQILGATFHTGSTVTTYVDGNSGTSAANSLNATYTKLLIRSNNSGPVSECMDGKMQEVLLYTSDQSANRTGIENNLNTFYNIYS